MIHIFTSVSLPYARLLAEAQEYVEKNQAAFVYVTERDVPHIYQADLANKLLLIPSVTTKDVVCPTDYELVILRIGRLIREKKLRSTDVMVHVFCHDGTRLLSVPCRFDDDGQFIDEWPEGFFEETIRELFDKL